MILISWNSTSVLPFDKSWIIETPDHFVKFTYSGNQNLLQVTFDYFGYDGASKEMPLSYGQKFAEDNGWSILGVISKRHIWFREEALHDIFDYLKESGFFSQFSRCVFLGASKGGYGALAFSSAAPGSVVVAVEPQSTLDKKIVPWETRYPIGDWKGRYVDGSNCPKSASAVYVFYDKFYDLDRRHAERLVGLNVFHIECNHMRHGLTHCFNKMGILKELMYSLVVGNFFYNDFRRIFRDNRLKTQRFARNLFDAALQRKHYKMCLRLCDALKDGDDRKYFVARKALLTAALSGTSALTITNSWFKRAGI